MDALSGLRNTGRAMTSKLAKKGRELKHQTYESLRSELTASKLKEAKQLQSQSQAKGLGQDPEA